MKAVVIHQERDLRIDEIAEEKPSPDQILVKILRGGICGSDLHYYHHGGFGTVRIKEPMILGHEVAGEIVATGANVTRVKIGDRIALNPSRPCGHCEYCQRGQQNQCLDMRFYGSAMRFPHVQGAFRQAIVAEATQAHVIEPGIAIEEAAFAEPFAVTLHAINRAGPLINKRVLVTGCGPIGALAIVAARAHGAREIIATDVSDFTLGLAKKMGADHTVNVATQADEMAKFKTDKGQIDVMIEASGNEAALHLGLEVLRPRGTLVQLGLGSSLSIPQNVIVGKEIEIRGSFRFHEEFGLAVDLINHRRVNVKPLLTEIVSLDDAKHGFDLATDRSKAMKVQIAFA
ncbi:MAG: L-idonate 5-dehydrogenase [Hyphomicrobiales bacterium]